MKLLTLALTLFASATITTAQTPVRNNGKRGLCFNDASLTRRYSLSGQNSRVSWAYNWYFQACPLGQPNCGLNPALDFIPMLYSDSSEFTSQWPRAAESAIANSLPALFSFNEPDACFAGLSACMSVERAVAAYKQYMMPYAGRIALGTPAVTNAGAPYGLTWLKRFMDACDGCRFDFVNIHWYSNKHAGLGYLQDHIAEAKRVTGHRRIMLTEFGLTHDEYPYTQAELRDFLRRSMDCELVTYSYIVGRRMEIC